MHSAMYKRVLLFFSGQIWRPITATFFFPVGPGTGFLYLVNLYFLYQYSSRLETGTVSVKVCACGKLCLELIETKHCQTASIGIDDGTVAGLDRTGRKMAHLCARFSQSKGKLL